MIMMMEEYQTAQLRGENMGGPPPDIESAFGVLQVWKMWKRRHAKKRQSPESDRESNLLLPLLAKKRRDELFSEWRYKSKMRVKGTQTTVSYLREIATQTDAANWRYLTSSPDTTNGSPPSPLVPTGPPVRRMSPAKFAQTNYLPLVPECLENLSNENLSATNANMSTVSPFQKFRAEQNEERPTQGFQPIDSSFCVKAEIHAEIAADIASDDEISGKE